MRIRKRWPLNSHLPPLKSTTDPDPSSPFSPPLDPQHGREGGNKEILPCAPSSERPERGFLLHPNGHRPTSNLHHMLLMRKTNGWIRTHPSNHIKAMKGNGEEENGENNEDKWFDGEKRSGGSNTRSVSSSSAKMAFSLVLPPLFSSHQVMEMEFEGEGVFSSKRKRGEGGGTQEVMEAKQKQMGEKPDDNVDSDETIDGFSGEGKKKGKVSSISIANGNGGVVMEGSRCSRVNGRGWRCSQQTLVGYALCEHHLGKGRLRSMNSVRSRTPPAVGAMKRNANNADDNVDNGDGILSLSSKLPEVLEEEDKMLHSMPSVTKKRRKKIGVVKARSMSSLLNQTDDATYKHTAISVPCDGKKENVTNVSFH